MIWHLKVSADRDVGTHGGEKSLSERRAPSGLRANSSLPVGESWSAESRDMLPSPMAGGRCGVVYAGAARADGLTSASAMHRTRDPVGLPSAREAVHTRMQQGNIAARQHAMAMATQRWGMAEGWGVT